MKPALLVIDVQKSFYQSGPQTAQSLDQAVNYINYAIDLFRTKNLPIVCIQHMDEMDGLVPGKEGFDLPDNLKILPSDIHIHKTYNNAFNKTSLASQLQELGVDTVILTGYAAEFCILATYWGAKNVDLTPVIFRGSIASDTPENAKWVESICNIISYSPLQKALG